MAFYANDSSSQSSKVSNTEDVVQLEAQGDQDIHYNNYECGTGPKIYFFNKLQKNNFE